MDVGLHLCVRLFEYFYIFGSYIIYHESIGKKKMSKKWERILLGVVNRYDSLRLVIVFEQKSVLSNAP